MVESANPTRGLLSRYCDKPPLLSSLTMTGAGALASFAASGNSEIGRQDFGIRRQAANMAVAEEAISWMMAAGDQIVVESVTMPMMFWRKWPLVATSSGPLAEGPNCQSACAP